jgi:hypothetical protein
MLTYADVCFRVSRRGDLRFLSWPWSAASSAYVSIRQHTSAYVSIRQHTSAYISIRQHTSAYAIHLWRRALPARRAAPALAAEAMGGRSAPQDYLQHTSAYVGIRQQTSAYVSRRQHTSAYVSRRQHTSAGVSIRQHTSAYVSGGGVVSPLCSSQLPASEIRQQTSAYVSIRQHTCALAEEGLCGRSAPED